MGRRPATKSKFAERVNEATQAAGEDILPPEEPPAACFAPFTLEEMFTAEWGSQIDTATNCQRAICRLLGGQPIGDLADDPQVIEMFGGTVPVLAGRPKVVMVLGGIRTCKSTIIADTAVEVSQNIEIPLWVRPSDQVRIPVVSTDKDTAEATFGHVRDTIMSSERLRSYLATDDRGKTKEPKTDSLLLRHPSGREIEVKVVALSRAGSTLTARWFASCIFDEAPRMGSDTDFVRSFNESFRASRGRILPGGIIMLGGSPHARVGPIYDLFKKHFRKPTQRFVVTKAQASWLNPVYWTPERCQEQLEEDPIVHQTDVLCDFKDPEQALGDSASIEAAMRETEADVPPVRGHHYVATMDPATRINTWTLTIVECHGHRGVSPMFRVAACRQWVPKPGTTLSPTAVFGECAELMRKYGLDEAYSDITGTDFAIELAAQSGIALHVSNNIDLLELGRQLFSLIKRNLFELANDNGMREDLQSVRTRTSSSGNVTPYLPKASGGRHCDYFPPLCLAVSHLPEPPDSEEELTWEDKDLQRELAECERRNNSEVDLETEASGWQ